MAPTKGTKKSNKTSGKKLGPTKDSKSRVSKSSASTIKRPPPKEQKSQRPNVGSGTKKRRVYTEKELGIPQLNMITPIGVQKPKGKKKGKVFVDDPQSMMTIMAMVNAEKEGQIESKMLRARQMEEIRQLKRQEQEQREAERKERLEDAKDSLRKKRRKRDQGSEPDVAKDVASTASAKKDGKKKKKVSFG